MTMTNDKIEYQRSRLISEIKIANNGYLNLDYMSNAQRDFAQKCALDGIVRIKNGAVYLPTTTPEFFKTPYPTKAFANRHDGPDYEGAILSRQENQSLS